MVANSVVGPSSLEIIDIQSAAESLERLTDEIQQNPRGLIGKGPSKELEVQP